VNRWSRIVLAISLAATLAWIAAGALGYRVHDARTLAIHTLVGFAALLALLLVHGWVVVFSVVSVRLLRAHVEPFGPLRMELVRTRNLAAVAGVAAIVTVLLQFTVSNALFPARLQPRQHALAAGLSLVVLVAAWAAEAVALARHGRVTGTVAG
jgi:hypothetical protein